MKIQKTVVGVCSGNIQRSPTFEAVFAHTVEKERADLLGGLHFTSAGTNVEKVLANQESPERVTRILEAAFQYGIIPDEFQAEVRLYLGKDGSFGDAEKERLGHLHSIFRPRLRAINIAYRTIALAEKGILYVPESCKPLHPEEQYALVLPMDEKACAAVQKRYNQQQIGSTTLVDLFEVYGTNILVSGTIPLTVPLIQPYATLVGQETPKEDMAGGLEGARRHVEYFMDTRQRALEQIIALTS